MVDYIFSNTTYFTWVLYVITHFSQLLPIRYSSKLFIALLLQPSDAKMYVTAKNFDGVEAMMCVFWRGYALLSLQRTQTKFQFIRNIRSIVSYLSDRVKLAVDNK